jgi:hypothetical protein
MHYAPDDPVVQAALEAAAQDPKFHETLQVLTSSERVRGCMVNSDRGHLQLLQNFVGWTIGGYDTRPTEKAAQAKNSDRLHVLITYRQPEDPGDPPKVAMYDYLCHSIFGVPMQPVGPEVIPTQYRNEIGEIVTPSWIEGDWDKFRASCAFRPPPIFAANKYPYQVPEHHDAEDAHDFHRRAQHWLLWYMHFPEESPADPGDEQIDQDVRREVLSVVSGEGFDAVDYIWYRNPAMSVPDLFHVQVFWIVPRPS